MHRLALGPTLLLSLACSQLEQGAAKDVVAPSCWDPCPELGQAECLGDSLLRRCVVSAAGCLEWAVAPCAEVAKCLVSPQCIGDACAGDEVDCDDGNPCTDDVCSPEDGQCLHEPNDDPCEDGDVCTSGDRCGAGKCVPGPCDCEHKEHPVSTYAGGSNQYPAVAALPGGGYLVAWEATGADGSGAGILARGFDASSCFLGPEMLQNQHTERNQSGPAAVALGEDRVAVAWASDGQDGSSWGVYGRVLTADGKPLTGELQLHQNTAGAQATVRLGASSGSALVALWWSEVAKGTVGRLFSNGGEPLTGEMALPGVPAPGGLAVLADARLAVTWQKGVSGDTNAGYACVSADLGSVASIGTANAFAPGYQEGPAVSGLLDTGGFVVAWTDGAYGVDGLDGDEAGVFGRTFDAGCYAVQSGDQQVNVQASGSQHSPRLAPLAAGGFVAVWRDDGGGGKWLARRFASDFSPASGAFPLSDDPSGPVMSSPYLATRLDGGFLAAWSREGPPVAEVYARTFPAPP